MLFIAFYILGWIAGIVAVFTSNPFTDVSSVSQILLLSHLTITLGLTGLFGFFGHVFMSDRIARSIGWATGSLFQVELGYCSLGMGILGITCFFIRDNFWLATIIFTSFFLVGAALVHIKQMINKGNFKPGNAIIILPDLLIPTTLIVLWILMTI